MSALWLCLLLVAGSSQAARVAGIFPTPSISHQLPFQAVMKALAMRGHHVTVISTDPLKEPHPNYTDIDLSFTYDYWRRDHDYTTMDDVTPYAMMDVFATAGVELCRLQLSSKVMQDFIQSQPKFDLVIIQDSIYHSYFGLVHHFGSPPIIGLLSSGPMTWTYDVMGNPNNPSCNPDVMLPYTDHMTFWQRANNMMFNVWMRFKWDWYVIPAQEKLMREFFGSGPPPIQDTRYNFSLYFVNNHLSLNYPRPLLPSVIELGSLHLQHKAKPLPKDLQEFLDGAEDGFVYFSLGSNVRSDKLPAEKRQQLLEAFSELPQRVLWKWESDSLPGQPGNVKLGKWLPQQDILAHPKIRLFVMQGGLQSLSEAVSHVVPVVGIPFIGDQRHNMAKIVAAGAGLKLEFKSITKEKVLETINTVLKNPSFRANMKRLSAINGDQPETPLERAVWWTEYVLRHNGTKHMRSTALDLAWWQYLLLDVIAFFTIALGLVLTAIFFVTRKLFRLLKAVSDLKPKRD